MGPILAIDQGTTSTRAILFDGRGRPLQSARRDLPQHYPGDGWVEHDAMDIWTDTLAVCREVLERAGLAADALACLGITNQRETAILWERETGAPVHRAIVWQDRRTADLCRALHDRGEEPLVRRTTGLLLDPYFSATKLAWMLDHGGPDLRRRAEAGELAFGTVDSWLLYKLTGGVVHATDATNAARTLLFDIRANRWSDALLSLFDIPAALLPQVLDNAGPLGETDPAQFGARVPITGMAGDQHAALVGQACLSEGMIKCTYGTGAFALLNIGERFVESRHRLLVTPAYRLNGRTTYALEGSIFVAGAAVGWLRDGLRAIDDPSQVQALAEAVPDAGGCHMVPAFTGLGAPYWDPGARGALLGLTRDTTLEHIARATLEAQGYQTRDLLEAMAADAGSRPRALRVDGGMAANDWVCQFLADINDLRVDRPAVLETTALGAALLAGLGAGLFPDLQAMAEQWRAERTFTPTMDATRRQTLYAGWVQAVRRVSSDLR
jgi:glycerol kinase